MNQNNSQITETFERITNTKMRIHEISIMIESMNKLYSIHSTTNQNLINNILNKINNEEVK